MRRSLLTGLLSLTLLSAGCGVAGAPSEPGAVSVVATTTIWADVVTEIVGEEGNVTSVIPIGGDAHDYQPSPQQVAALQTADLVIANGLGLEEGLGDVLDNIGSDGANVYEVGPDLDPIPFQEHTRNDDDGHEEDEGLDPHVWFDPERMARAAQFIADRLGELDDAIDWAARADVYADRLLETDAEIATILTAVAPEDRKLVTNHDALGYFAARYDFEVIGVVIPGGSTLGEPSSAELAALIEEIEHEGVGAIFAETTSPTALAEAVAAEAGADVVVIELFTGSLGESGSGAETLLDMLLSNARLIADGLS